MGLPPGAGPLINASGHKFGLVYRGIGWLIFREKSDLAEDLVFHENYSGKDRPDLHPELLNRLLDDPRPVLQLRALGQGGLSLGDGDDAGERPVAGQGHRRPGQVQIIGEGDETLPLVAFNLADDIPMTSSTSPFSSMPSGAGWSPPTPCRRTPRT